MRLIILIGFIGLLLLGQRFFLHSNKTPFHIYKERSNATPTAKKTLTPTFVASPTEEIHTHTFNPTNTPTLADTYQGQQNISSSISWQYPSSHQVNSQGNTLYYESTEDVTVITNWYKDAIKNKNMNTTSIIQNNSNGNVNNQINASNGNNSLRISITKDANESTVHISVTSS